MKNLAATAAVSAATGVSLIALKSHLEKVDWHIRLVCSRRYFMDGERYKAERERMLKSLSLPHRIARVLLAVGVTPH